MLTIPSVSLFVNHTFFATTKYRKCPAKKMLQIAQPKKYRKCPAKKIPQIAQL